MRPKNSGAKPIIYGDRTFKGWESYYKYWGTRAPSKRTICAHYAKCKSAGLTDEETIEAQKRLWIEEVSEDGKVLK